MLVHASRRIARAAADTYGPLYTAAADAGARILGNVRSTLAPVIEALNTPLTAEERAAAQTVETLLAPNKLGGRDGRFNHDDLDAVVGALMRDRPGLRATVVASLRREGSSDADLVDRALRGERGIIASIARGRVEAEAPGRIRAEIAAGLTKGGVRPRASAADATPRNLTFAELRRFEAALETLRGRQERVRRQLGIEVSFPDGPSLEAMRFLLEGRVGLPPGATIAPARTR